MSLCAIRSYAHPTYGSCLSKSISSAHSNIFSDVPIGTVNECLRKQVLVNIINLFFKVRGVFFSSVELGV
jgi:hypothetical protein